MDGNIVGIKAGSSVFKDDSCYQRIAEMLVDLSEEVDQLYFVVSAVKGATDATIAEIAQKEAQRLGLDYAILHTEFGNALKGKPSPYLGMFNTPEIAAALVQPEMHSVDRLVAELSQRGVSVAAMRHGTTYPLLGADNGSYLYATPDVEASRKNLQRYDAKIVVVPGFGVRNQRGEIMCTGRGSSDLTLAQIGTLYDLSEIVYWKDTGGFWKGNGPEQGVYNMMTRDLARERGGDKVLDNRIYDYSGNIRITREGKLIGGTVILPDGVGLEQIGRPRPQSKYTPSPQLSL